MNELGDSTPSAAPAESADVESEPPERLSITIVSECGDWSTFASREGAIAEAAAAVARHPRCRPARGAEACVVLANDALVRLLNRSYRGKDAPTNVLSFPFSPAPAGARALHIGDVVLAVETIQNEAGEQGIAPVHHLQHLVVHGLLHLLGFDHDTAVRAEAMEGLEAQILAALGIANPYPRADGQ
jgi:probable rRNA maturation factor